MGNMGYHPISKEEDNEYELWGIKFAPTIQSMLQKDDWTKPNRLKGKATFDKGGYVQSKKGLCHRRSYK